MKSLACFRCEVKPVRRNSLFKGHRSPHTDLKRKTKEKEKTQPDKNPNKTQNKWVLLKTHFTHWCEFSHWINFLVESLQILAVLILYSRNKTLLGEEFSFIPSLSPCFPAIRFLGIRSLKPSVVQVQSISLTKPWNEITSATLFSYLSTLPE